MNVSLLVVAVCLVAGLALRHVRGFPAASAVPALNAFAIYVALPALVLRQVAALRPSGDALLPLVVPWVVLGVSAGIVVVLARAAGWSRAVTGALLLVVPLGNTAFIGLPLVGALLGREALPFAILYDQIGSFLALTLYGSWIATRYSNVPEERGDAEAPMRRPHALVAMATFPPLIALVLGLLLGVAWPDGLPVVLDETLAAIAASLVPTVLVAVGLAWRLVLPSGSRAPFALALVVKLAVSPLVAFALVSLVTALLAAPGEQSATAVLAADASILQAAMGPMVTAGALATARGLAPELAAAIVGYGTLASLGTVLVVHAVLL